MTTSNYTGIYSYKRDDGTITDVQVEDPHGNSLSLPIDEYQRRGIQPPAASLPDQKQFNAR